MTQTKRFFLVAAVLFTGIFTNVIFSGTLLAEIENFFDDSLPGQMLWYLLPVTIILLLFHKPTRLFDELGMNRSFIKGFGYAFLFTLPMLVGLSIIGNFNPGDSIIKLLAKTFKEGFTEEVFFRAFLFGQLFRHCRWGFISAAIVPAVIFGIGHLYQGDTLLDSLGAFGITFLGAIWFSWLFTEWKYNLWLPVGMHFLMNFYWGLFNISEGALGNIMANVFRGITIFISIYITIKLVKRSNGHLLINKGTLLKNPASQ